MEKHKNVHWTMCPGILRGTNNKLKKLNKCINHMLDLSEVPGTERRNVFAGQSCWYSLLLWSKCSGSNSQHQWDRKESSKPCTVPPTPGGQLWPQTPAQTACLYESTSITPTARLARRQYRKPSLF